MPLRRTAFATVVATALILGLSGCGGHDQAAPPATDTPLLPVSTPTPTPTLDRTAAAKAKVLADYKNYVAVWTKGKVSGDPAYPYDQVMTGEALRLTKAVAAADDLRGIKASGGVKYLYGSVVALNLSAKPATARVESCEADQINGVDKKGRQVYRPVGQVSSDTNLALVSGRWKVTRKVVSGKEDGACAG
jgi:hypothetical protein